MTRASADWARVERLLDEALDLAPEDRTVFLERACAGDAALRERLASLLRAADAAGRFLERPAPEVAAGLVQEMVHRAKDDAEASAPPFERVGPYRLIREIGRGGMGAVYLAERDDDQYHRQVAVKLVQVAAPELMARFRSERQILASLDHPNIARLYDGGTAENGVPYLVMEHIAGQRIDAYCDDRRLPVADRLRLFDTVCAAVEFAHQNLVVHRDLKPSNVLVAEDGAVKLLDFGVAKLLDSDSAAAQVTETGPRALTPEYASPELLRGAPVSTAADVYALGVLLYELLSGRRPYDFTGRSPVEIERIVVEREPAKPSVAATQPADDGAGTAPRRVSPASERRGTTVDGLRRRLAGDLDNVVLTALRKEPEQRYASVHHLRDDVRRHLEGLPVSARPATWGYRAGKFLGRHRVGMAAAAVIALSLAGGLAGTTWQAGAAAREARRAEQVRDFLVGLFESSDPDSTMGRTVTAKELLERGAARLDSELAAEPVLRAEMLGVVGRIYRELGLYPQARPLLEEALAVRRAGRADADDIAESAGELSSVLYEQGEYDSAETLAREVVAIRRARARTAPARLSASLADLAAVLSTRGEAKEADSLYREALAIDRALDDPEGLAAHLADYGVSLWRASRYEEAQRADEEALALRRAFHGDEHTDVATSLLNLATVLMERGEYARADSLMRECLAIRRRVLGPGHPHVAATFNNLGDLMTRAGRLDDAEHAHRQALAIRREALGDAHPDVATSTNNLGVVLYFKGRYSEAAETFEQVLPIWRASYGPHHAHVFSALNNLGASLREAGDLDAAERVLRETLALRRDAFGDQHAHVAQSYNNLARLLALRGTSAEAEASYRQATTIWRQALGDEHPDLGDGLVGFGVFLLDGGRCREAEPLLREGLAIRDATLDPQAPLLASARLYLGECLVRLDRGAEADTLLAAALPVLREHWGDTAQITRRALRAVAEVGRR